MWSATKTTPEAGRIHQFTLFHSRTPVTYSTVIDLWQNDDGFRSFFVSSLKDSDFSAFKWETPPITRATIDRPFEFVLIDSPGLDRPADPEAFAEHFNGGDLPVVTFSNLGNDAVLVVPRPVGSNSDYGHLAAFLRNAPQPQQHDLWQSVGEAVATRLTDKPLWLSTAGMGVPWLHVRLDSRPKYYGFETYRNAVPKSPAG